MKLYGWETNTLGVAEYGSTAGIVKAMGEKSALKKLRKRYPNMPYPEGINLVELDQNSDDVQEIAQIYE